MKNVDKINKVIGCVLAVVFLILGLLVFLTGVNALFLWIKDGLFYLGLGTLMLIVGIKMIKELRKK